MATGRFDPISRLLAEGLAVAPGAVTVRLFTGEPPAPAGAREPEAALARDGEPSWMPAGGAVVWDAVDWWDAADDEDGAMRWSPGCRETACALCDPDDSDGELLEHCAGFPWTQGVTVAVGEDVTIRARKCGTGWV